MIKVIKKGNYQIIQESADRILILDKRLTFDWKMTQSQEFLITPREPLKKLKQTTALGTYRLYEVRDEKNISDGMHLELFLGKGKWQGYIISKKLGKTLDQATISDTHEVISKSLDFFPTGISLL